MTEPIIAALARRAVGMAREAVRYESWADADSRDGVVARLAPEVFKALVQAASEPKK